jgi:thiol-disulfide isomerase/thioredoxin
MRRAIAGVLLVLLGAGCAPQGDGGGLPGPGRVEVDTDTTRLRTLKEEAGVEQCVPGHGEEVEGGLPDVTLPCLGGGPDVALSSLRGPLVVSFWASYCTPCRTELPIYQEFHERYGDRVPVLGVDFNDLQLEQALALIKRTGATFPLLADPNSDVTGAGLRVTALPTVAFVDEDGRVTSYFPKRITSLGQLEDLVEEHLGVRL